MEITSEQLADAFGIGYQKIKVKATYDFGSKVAVNGKIEARIVATKKAKTYKYATVKFLSKRDEGYSQGYTYENPIGAKKYDAVIVPTQYGLSLAVVEGVSDSLPDSFRSHTTLKAVVEVIKSEAVAKVMQAEKKKDLKKKLEAEVKKMDEVERFNIYAANNPVFAELLDEYKSL